MRIRPPAEIIEAVRSGELASAAAAQVGRTSTEALDQSEIIGLRELHALAAKLSRRDNPQHAQLGRALTKALAGEAFAAEGNRNQLTYKLAGEIIEAYPFADPTAVVPHFLAALSNQGEPRPEQFHRQLETHQSKKQGKAESLRTVGERVQLPGSGAPPWTPSPNAGPSQDVPGAPLPERGTKDVIVLADGIYYVRHPQGDTYELQLKSAESLRLELQNQFGNANGMLNLIDPMGRLYTNEIILAQYGSNATGGIVKDFSADATRFDANRATLTVGQRMLSTHAAAPDIDVEVWLRALAGDTDEALIELYDWIASTDQRYISRPAAALAIVGAKDSAKSLFGRCLAMTWQALNAVPMGCVVERFNGALVDCPIWHADEEMPRELTGHVFRDLVQSRDRYIEPKGKEKVRLLGAPRLLITVNQVDDIRIKGANGPDAVSAIADRLAIYQAADETRMAEVTAALRLPGSYDLDLGKIVAHLRYVQLNVQPREQRFYGGKADKTAAMAPVLLAAVESCPPLFELIYQWFMDPLSIEREYHIEPRQWSGPGKQFPIISEAGGMYVRNVELAARLRIEDYIIRLALAPFEKRATRSVGKTDQISFGNKKFRSRFLRLDHERLISVLGPDLQTAVWTVATKTRERINLGE